MTRDEAIRYFENRREGSPMRGFIDACEMAIEALTEQSTNNSRLAKEFDLIARNTKFKALTLGGRYVYALMFAKSNTSRTFTFSHSQVAEYGMTENTFRSAARQLEKSGFIKVKRYATQCNIYSLSEDWKA